MVARNVQVSLDESLVRRIDSRPETRRLGRSAIVRRALELYLERATEADIDEAYRRGYGGASAEETDREFAPFLAIQAWPEDEDEQPRARRTSAPKRRGHGRR
jgi:metal-responsive CopG/Arc/MetJ family transcriptional regulator